MANFFLNENIKILEQQKNSNLAVCSVKWYNHTGKF